MSETHISENCEIVASPKSAVGSVAGLGMINALGAADYEGADFIRVAGCWPTDYQSNRSRYNFTSILPMFSPEKSFRKEEGACAMPTSTVGRKVISPAFNPPSNFLKNAARPLR